MTQANFAYGEAGRQSAFSAGVYASATAARLAVREAVETAGFVALDYDLLAELDEVPPPLPADVLVIECPVQDGATLAALVQLDTRAAREGTRLVVSTTMSALDTVFACLDQSGAEILLQPSKGERVIALARALLKGRTMTVRELDEADRLTLLRLTEQVGQIAAQLDRLSAGEAPAFRLESRSDDYRGEGDEERKLIRSPRPPLPDPRLVRRIIGQRRARDRFFGAELFADPAWDMLLDLTAARAEHQRVSVTSLCIASSVPPTTALRWINQMIEAGLLERVEDDSDRRRAFLELSDRAADAMARYFAELGKDAKALI